MISKKIQSVQEVFTGRVGFDQDLFLNIKEILETNSITNASIKAIGAVQCANIAWYNQQTKEYEEKFFDEEMEILTALGNVSTKDGEIFPHIHITLGKRDFSLIGGHLLPNTKVFACELEITVFDGATQQRSFDEDTKLFLWK